MTTFRSFPSSRLLRALALTALAAGATLAPAARAQEPGADPIAERLFPPELVMRHAEEIGLDERQRSALKDAVQKAQSRFLDAQWDMQAEQQKLVRLLEARPVEEAAVLAQVDRVLGLEREVKRTHLALLVRIKNLLSREQQDRLQELRRRAG
ncbi:MAG: Spy/CpxP family protein refolding chaperone [Thermoanaerobaculia bacterium]